MIESLDVLKRVKIYKKGSSYSMMIDENVKQLLYKCLDEKLKITILQIQRRIKLPFAKAKSLHTLLLESMIIDKAGYVIINRNDIESLELIENK